MKKCAVIFMFVLMLVPGLSLAAEENDSFDDVLKSELSKFDLSQLDDLRNHYAGEDIFQGKDIKTVVLEFASGNQNINVETLINSLLMLVLTGVKDGLINLSVILFTVIVCGMLKSMSSDSLGDISDICEYVGFIIIVSMLLNTFVYYVDLTIDMMGIMQSAVRIIFPPLLTLMTAIGGVSSLGVFKPAMAVLSGGMIEFMGTSILPIAVLGGATGILSGLSQRINIQGISDFCNSLCKWLMGIAFTVYAGILSIQGIMAATYDGVYIRTAKYTVDSFMPIIGGMMSDTVDTVLGCSLLIKNAIGFTGLLVIGSICIMPLVKYITCILSYKLVGALISATSSSWSYSAIEGLTSAVTTLFTIVCVIAVMTFITIALAVNAGNTNLMLR